LTRRRAFTQAARDESSYKTRPRRSGPASCSASLFDWHAGSQCLWFPEIRNPKEQRATSAKPDDNKKTKVDQHPDQNNAKEHDGSESALAR
jgi:hypothetical protein